MLIDDTLDSTDYERSQDTVSRGDIMVQLTSSDASEHCAHSDYRETGDER